MTAWYRQVAKRWRGRAVRGAVAAVLLGRPAQAEGASSNEDVRHDFTPWIALMSQLEFRNRLGVWFDTHYNPRSFAVTRPGLTYRFDRGPSLTAGYAFVLLDDGRGVLRRDEHRPWAQAVVPFRIGDRWSFSGRLRYDYRIQRNVEDGALLDGYAGVHRARLQSTLTYRLPPLRQVAPFLQVAHELLLNFGRNGRDQRLDQNRISALVGLQVDDASLRVGYMDRLVPRSGRVLHEHALLLWWTQRFSVGARGDALPTEASNP